MKLKIITMISTAILIAFVLSCGKSDPVDNIKETAAQNEDAENKNGQGENETEDGNSVGAKPEYALPANDFAKYEFRILCRGEEVQHWWNNDISAEAETGDPINDAVFTRNQTIEEKYNITLKSLPDASVGAKASRSIKAGSDDYDLVVVGLRDGQDNLMTSGYLFDLMKMPYIDLTKPWWDQKAAEQLSINKKLFATSCDVTVRDKDAIIILMFSKTLLKNNELEDPYQLVLSGKWTLDKMHSMMKAASKDINGDGAMDVDDQYGLLTQYKHSQYLFNGAEEYMSSLNSEKIPEITIYSERAAAICEKILEIQGDKNITINAEQAASKFTDIWDAFQVPMFAEDRALFYHAGMNRVTLLRTMETDFGIIPPPKYDESQKNYHAAVDAWCTSAVSVPVTVSDKERTGLILEALAYESRYTLLPAYYDINLKTKFARDEESRGMIDIILANRLYDLGDMYDWGSIGSYFGNLSQSKSDSLSTYWEKNSAKIESAMQKSIDKLLDIE